VITYLPGCGPSGSGLYQGPRQPQSETCIWRPGDVGWVADIIQAAWSRWLVEYPAEWRTLGQAVPYIHLRSSWCCDRPKHDDLEQMLLEDYEQYLLYEHWPEVEEWERAGSVGPPPEKLSPQSVGHTHGHDHGICLDPWLVDQRSEEFSIEGALRHELAHAIAGSFGHLDEWLTMCEVIGHELTPGEREQCRREREAERKLDG
jgi:hypothetical protein